MLKPRAQEAGALLMFLPWRIPVFLPLPGSIWLQEQHSFRPLTLAHHAPHGLFTESFLCGVPAALKCLLEESAGLAASKSPFLIIYLRALGAPCFNPGILFNSLPFHVCFPNPQQVPKLDRNNPEEIERRGELGGALSGPQIMALNSTYGKSHCALVYVLPWGFRASRYKSLRAW